MKFTYASGSRPLDGYTIKRGIGHGGFGEVYYAVSDGGKEVAIKLVQRNLEVELRGVAQCMNLKHPNLVTLYDLRTNDSGEHFVVMEYVGGKSLADEMEDNPNGFSHEKLRQWMKGICEGVGYLHDKGIVHRDLKPGNLFMEDGLVKVVDYGLSKFITASRRSGQTESVGTVHYMAPEISQGRYDREIDIYAAGVILYEMLTGKVPFDGESVGEILMKHLTSTPDVSVLPAPFDAIVARALQKDPTMRFRSMDELLAAINGLPQPVQAARPQETAQQAPGAAPPNPAPPGPAARPKAAPMPNPAAPVPTATNSGGWWTVVIVLVALSFSAMVTGGRFGIPGPSSLLVVAIVVGAILLSRRKQRPQSRHVHRPQPAPVRPAQNPPVPVRPAEPPRVRVIPAPKKNVAPKKGFREKLAETTSGMLLMIILSAIAGLIACSPMGLKTLNEFWVLAATCLAGCWAVLIPAKLWEGRKGDPILRRIVMGALGLGVGCLSIYLDGLLNTGIYSVYQNGGWMLAPEWLPEMFANAGFFGIVFMIIDWWAYADARRGIRFNPWWVAVPCFWSAMLALIIDGPPSTTWAIVVTGLIAGLVQVGSPVDEPRRRAA